SDAESARFLFLLTRFDFPLSSPARLFVPENPGSRLFSISPDLLSDITAFLSPRSIHPVQIFPLSDPLAPDILAPLPLLQRTTPPQLPSALTPRPPASRKIA